jgi:hypothetical protein
LHESVACKKEGAEEIERNEARAQNADGDRHYDNALIHRRFDPSDPKHDAMQIGRGSRAATAQRQK